MSLRRIAIGPLEEESMSKGGFTQCSTGRPGRGANHPPSNHKEWLLPILYMERERESGVIASAMGSTKETFNKMKVKQRLAQVRRNVGKQREETNTM